jgi:hypothetical protein
VTPGSSRPRVRRLTEVARVCGCSSLSRGQRSRNRSRFSRKAEAVCPGWSREGLPRCRRLPYGARMRRTLHEAMVVVLREHSGVMSSEDLARVIAERDLYRRADGDHPRPHQLRARAMKYPHLLQASDDGTGRIELARRTRSGHEELVVFCADVGSVAHGKFGWARSAENSARDIDEVHDHSKPSDLVRAVCRELGGGRPVALGFECPLFVPVPTDDLSLGRARAGEGNRSWSAGAGSGALTTGIVQAAWVLDAIRQQTDATDLWLDWSAFLTVRRGLFLWEAFVSGAAKGATHVDDASIAVAAFVAALPDPREGESITAERPLSLIGAAAMWSGWSTDDELLRVAPLVVRAS